MIWKHTTDGQYSTKLAYTIQFKDVVRPFNSKHLWKAKAEPKVLLLGWITLHEKALTADNLEEKCWDNNVICPLYLDEMETNFHLLVSCSFTQEVQEHITS